MLKNKILVTLLICNITTGLNALNSNFDNTLDTATQIAAEISSGFKNSSKKLSLEDLKKLTNDLVNQLKTIPNYVMQSNGMLIIEKESPVTSGISIWKKEISKQKFIHDIDIIETLSKQATQSEQFKKIIELIHAIFSNFNIAMNK